MVTGTATLQTHDLINSYGDILELGIEPISVSPSIKSNAPRYTPKEVETHFLDGLKILSVGVWSSAGNSFRTTLEKATDYLIENRCEASNVGHRSLRDRIKFLKEKNMISIQIFEWAEIIRTLGNMGTHGDPEFTEKDACELKHFTEKFLEYVFTMPEEVRKTRKKLESK